MNSKTDVNSESEISRLGNAKKPEHSLWDCFVEIIKIWTTIWKWISLRVGIIFKQSAFKLNKLFAGLVKRE